MRYAIAVAEERSFTRAAERCLVVQSALSHQIKALERELGVELFARTSRRVEVTSAGEAFVASARDALAAADRAAAEARATSGIVTGALRIGVIPTVTALDLPAVLGTFHDRHPSVAIQMQGGSSDLFVDRLATGQLDAAVLGLHGDVHRAGVDTHVLAKERLVAVVPSSHVLAGSTDIHLADLAGEVFADFPHATPGRMQSDLAFASAGLARDVAFEAASAEMIIDLVANGLVIALLPRAVVPERPGIQVVPVTDGPLRIEYLAWNAFNPSPATRAFLEIVRDSQ